MRGIGRIAVMGLVLLAACSGGGGGSAASTTTSSATTSTTLATTTTTSPEEAVKAAYLAYWKMIDRVSVNPDPDDPELPQRMVDPRLSNARDELATEKAKGHSTRTPDGGRYSHDVTNIQVSGQHATIADCSIDDQVVFGPDGSPIDSEVTTKHYAVSLVLVADTWKVADSRIIEASSGIGQCDG